MHRVFVSYAEEDQEAASRLCEMLEADGTGCWLASRDATGAKDETAEIGEALRSSELVVLVFSASTNASPRVLREIEEAVAHERPVLPVRVDDALPGASLDYYLNLASPPGAMTSPEIGKEPEIDAGAEVAGQRRSSRRTWGIALGAVLALLAIGLGLGLGLTGTAHQATWTELKPSGPLPPARGGATMAYDPSTGGLIVFGGAIDDVFVNDTWAYDLVANTWTELDPSGTLPPPRQFHSMAYDQITSRLIVFGGTDENTGKGLNDTWAYDPVASTWTKLNPESALPPARSWQTMVCDSDTGKLIMFGGLVGVLQDLVPEDQLNDTWAYDPGANTWTDLNPAGAVPPARFAQAMAYDPTTHRMILFGGGSGSARYNDTWAFDSTANAWTNLNPAGGLPPARGGHTMVYDPNTRKLIMFGGGVSETELFDDTWAYDPSANTWAELHPSGTAPTARGGASAAYDPAIRRLIVFGGADDTGTLLDDTWALTP